MNKKARVLEQFKLWDIPATMERMLKAIVKKYPNKPMWIIVWEYPDVPVE